MLPGATACLSGVRVLLVEPHQDNRALFEHELEACGADVIAMPDAAEAMTTFDEIRPDAVVVHPRPTDADHRALAARARLAGIAAVAVSGHGRREDVEAILALGFQVHLLKPLSPEALCEAVRELLPRGRDAN